MTQQWKFTALEFIVLCEQYREGSLPTPFLFVTDEVVMADDLARRKRAAWEDLRRRLGGSFDGAIQVLTAPELFVRVRSWDEQDENNMSKQYHLHAARAGALGYLFEQRPGLLTYDTPAFTVTECDPRGLANAVVDRLPQVEAGRSQDIPIVTDPAEHITPTWGTSYVRDDRDSSPVYQTQQFFQRRADCTGSIIVVQGRSKYGPRGIHETKMMWRDVADDGRYLMSLDGAPIAVATGRRQLTERIQRDIDHLMQRLETHWEDGRVVDRY
ncbi:ESAT-6 protein secretion system EspG family protein [Nocardia tenerifensis]|uniref:ESAT-6 protein secretion system EspG family protein n=1 Tax=Nocardia tenerifensis TaxID=228006 RepID=A0A318JQ09_9NOCA|nr:ESX secretion-associated protein EspG [Nocardia tenerifensis]PXX57621.1 ESAT-6 protein secretion system EspG family protein [Nocardia tenerifensis]